MDINADQQDLISVCLESPIYSLRLSSKWSFTKVNSHFSVFTSLELELSKQTLEFMDGH